MISKVEELANEIMALDESEQQLLWKYVADLSFLRGLFSLSDKYRERLRMQKEMELSVEEILSNMKRIRDEIASSDYKE